MFLLTQPLKSSKNDVKIIENNENSVRVKQEIEYPSPDANWHAKIITRNMIYAIIWAENTTLNMIFEITREKFVWAARWTFFFVWAAAARMIPANNLHSRQ